jgi:hypothetical protein
MTSTTPWRRTLGVVVAVVALVVLSACGGTDDEGVASAGESEQNPDAQALVFAECMRDNGVDMPDPGPGAEGLGEAFRAVAGEYDQATLDQALSACEDRMPEYASEEQHEEGWELELAECLREQGLDVSDNPFDDVHRGDVDVNEFTEAMEVCRDVLINGGS